MTALDLVREHFGPLSDEEADTLLWEATANLGLLPTITDGVDG